MLIGIVCQQITILVSIPLSIVVLMYICSVSSGASRHIMLLYSVLHCACIQLLRNIYMKDYLLLYAFCCEFFSCRSDWIPSPCQLLPQVEISIEGCSQFKIFVWRDALLSCLQSQTGPLVQSVIRKPGC